MAAELCKLTDSELEEALADAEVEEDEAKQDEVSREIWSRERKQMRVSARERVNSYHRYGR